MREYPFSLENDKKYYSWVPTTLTCLSFEFLADKSNLQKNKSIIYKDASTKKAIIINYNPPLSDKFLMEIEEIFKKNNNELKPITTVHITEKNDIFVGYTELEFFYITDFEETLKNKHNIKKDFSLEEIKKTFNNTLIKFKIEFSVQKDGKVVFSNFQIHGKFIEDEIIKGQPGYKEFFKEGPYIMQREFSKIEIEFILQALYTFTKRAFHADIHHHEKIDIIIPVLESFDYKKICESIGNYIKIIEKEVVDKIYIDIDRAARAEGIYAYAESFRNKFSKGIDISQNDSAENVCFCSQIKNIITSIKSKDTREKASREKKVKNYLDIFTDFKFIITLLPGTFILFFAYINFVINGKSLSFTLEEKAMIESSTFITYSKDTLLTILNEPFSNPILIIVIVVYITLFLKTLIKSITIYIIKKIGTDRYAAITQINRVSFKYFIVLLLLSLFFALGIFLL